MTTTVPFLLPSTMDATWRLRSFTPAGVEVFGAGHNALSAWWWLASAGELELDRAPSRVRYEGPALYDAASAPIEGYDD